MYPVMLDVKKLPVLLAGRGKAVARRLALLDEAGAASVRVFAPDPEADLVTRAGDRLSRRLPAGGDLARARLAFFAGLPASEAESLAMLARDGGALVNVEDEPALSDFHSAAQVRRGDLVIAVSTGGKSPALARRLRLELEDRLGPEWADRLGRLAAEREEWRRSGVMGERLARLSEDFIDRNGWRL